MPTRKLAELARQYYAAYVANDRKFVENRMTDDFRFYSPVDDGIDRAAFFERCWPNNKDVESLAVVKALQDGSDVLVIYELDKKDGAKFQNAELLRFDGDKLSKVDVFFGRKRP
jgi:hypothetical protein